MKSIDELLSRSWCHQITLPDGRITPGKWKQPHIQSLLDGIDLADRTVLDIGTHEGKWALLAESRGAIVTATDLVPEGTNNFRAVTELLNSKIRYVQSSVYELPSVLPGEKFDVVFFLGVLYHLKHPLIGLQAVRKLLKDNGVLAIESAIWDSDGASAARFFYNKPLIGDATNWWLPNRACLPELIQSTGFIATSPLQLAFRVTSEGDIGLARGTMTAVKNCHFRLRPDECWDEFDKRL